MKFRTIFIDIIVQSRHWGSRVWGVENSSLGQGGHWGAPDWADPRRYSLQGIQRRNPQVLSFKQLCLPWNNLYGYMVYKRHSKRQFSIFQLLMMFLWGRTYLKLSIVLWILLQLRSFKLGAAITPNAICMLFVLACGINREKHNVCKTLFLLMLLYDSSLNYY